MARGRAAKRAGVATPKRAPKEPAVSLRERVKAPPAPALVESYYVPSVARALDLVFDVEMRIHLAHGLMLVRQGIVAASPMRQILAAVRELRAAGPGALSVDYSQEDLYSYTERYLVARLGADVGGRLHTARSRNDLNVTAWRIALRERLLEVAAALAALRRTALDLAGRHALTVMPGYTHSQHAQPISLGYYYLSVADMLARDHARLMAAHGRVDRCPLGAGALTTTGFAIDRDYTARLLAFPGLVEIAYDAVSSRDDALETAAALAVLMTNLSRVAVDLQNWNTAEYGFIELADEYSSVSSIMPQKKNPQALEHAKAVAAEVTGALMSVLGAVKNTSFSDVNDGVTAVNGPVLTAVRQTRAVLVLMDGVLNTLTVRTEAMAQAAARGYGSATELADAIVRQSDLSFRVAHNIVGRTVRDALAAGLTADRIQGSDIDRAAVAVVGRPLRLPAVVVSAALDPARNLAVRTVRGGPAAKEIRRIRADRVDALMTDQADVKAVFNHRENMDRRLDVAAKALISGRPPPR
ncbi:MAG: argininosuccinate lyase [Alphaproteobacteria bacterium]|nr:argininosuccinate lyase [Alphaproteobacteria bacterium]